MERAGQKSSTDPREVGDEGRAIEGFSRQGFTEHFGVMGHTLRGLESGKVFGANEVVIRAYDRFEGVSDPDDMSIVYAIESVNGTRGTLVDAFGVYSSPVISAFLDRVPIQRPAPPRATIPAASR